MAGELAGKKVLLVDDDRDIVATIQAALADLGPEIITAGDGKQAVELAQQHQPDIVILDMMLPKRSGFLVLERLKSGKKRTDPPRVIMITGNEGLRHREYAHSRGADFYFNKPFRMEKLLESVMKLAQESR